MDCSLPCSSIRGIFQARILEWVAISFSRGSSQPRDQTQVSCTAGRFFTVWASYLNDLPHRNVMITKRDHFRESALYAVKVKVKVKSLSRVLLFEPARLLSPWDFPGKSTRVGCHFLLQGIFPTQGSNLGLLHCRQTLYRLTHQGSLWRQMLLPGCLKFFPETNSNVSRWINESTNEELSTTIHKTDNKDLPHSTGSPTQYSAMTCMGKNLKSG